MFLKISTSSVMFLAGVALAAPATAPAPAVAATAQTARVARTTDLRDRPANDGAMLRVVPANTAVEVAERQGGWYKVSIAGQAGWMRLSAVRFGAASASSGAQGGSSTLGFLQSGRSAVTKGSVTTGVRGLSEEGLQRAEPNHAAVAALDGLAVTGDDARRYAGELPLAAASVAYVSAPEKDKDERKSKRKSKGAGGGG
jgi:uncharacterized protein YgiM (DUF1202 family)